MGRQVQELQNRVKETDFELSPFGNDVHDISTLRSCSDDDDDDDEFQFKGTLRSWDDDEEEDDDKTEDTRCDPVKIVFHFDPRGLVLSSV